ncbi:hypothetical protein F2Q69_00042812 [Brassica cretica]|uniref:Uncharacterized protein n=1 Tax=Brassica cretica TaxID=69181 RepID=A0A8S9NN63_BRACR|nr:hypothetical protein F2Q69_00042812 [Brassica cretica]
MGKLGLRKRLVQGYPENSFSEAIHLLLIDSSLDMLRNRFLSSPQGICALSRRSMSQGAHRSMSQGAHLSMSQGVLRSIIVSECRPTVLLDDQLGCFL